MLNSFKLPHLCLYSRPITAYMDDHWHFHRLNLQHPSATRQSALSIGYSVLSSCSISPCLQPACSHITSAFEFADSVRRSLAWSRIPLLMSTKSWRLGQLQSKSLAVLLDLTRFKPASLTMPNILSLTGEPFMMFEATYPMLQDSLVCPGDIHIQVLVFISSVAAERALNHSGGNLSPPVAIHIASRLTAACFYRFTRGVRSYRVRYRHRSE